MKPIVLNTDELLGLVACVEEGDADGLRDFLVESGVPFTLDSEKAARLAGPGQRVFVFGEQHALSIRDLIADYGLPVEIAEGMLLKENRYRPPVEQLLRLGEPKRHGTGVDYIRLGIGPDHVTELIRMATDEELHTGPSGSRVVWAPVHAWWALAQLRAKEAIHPLLGLFRRVDEDFDDWVDEDVPRVLAQMGPSTIGPVTEFLADATRGDYSRILAAKTLGLMGANYPETRADCVARLTAQLERFAVQTGRLNGFLISTLLDLRAIEVTPVMERAFAAERVDEMVAGDWEDIQIELGLKTKRERPRKPTEFTQMGEELRTALGCKLNDDNKLVPLESQARESKVGRNDLCPCGSGKKFKKCCGR